MLHFIADHLIFLPFLLIKDFLARNIFMSHIWTSNTPVFTGQYLGGRFNETIFTISCWIIFFSTLGQLRFPLHHLLDLVRYDQPARPALQGQPLGSHLQ